MCLIYVLSKKNAENNKYDDQCYETGNKLSQFCELFE